MRKAITFVFAWFVLSAAYLAVGAPKYTPTIPPGYSGEVVLHVDYGTTPDKIRVDWAEDPTSEPASINHMRVVGDRFYFIDAVVDTIKQYRSPGVFVWESKILENAHFLDVAPDGKVYAVWGAAVDQLSCIDSKGKLLWTKQAREVVPREKLKEFGIRPFLHGFWGVEWTAHGLTVTIMRELADGAHEPVAVLLDATGKLARPLPGFLVGSDGTVYSYEVDTKPPFVRRPLPPSPIEGKDSKGKSVRTIRPDLGPSKATRLAGNPVFAEARPDPAGGLVLLASADLPPGVETTRAMLPTVEHVIWRFDVHGKLKEEWRFPVSIFAHGRPEVVVGSDGCVYRLDFGETGIDVIKYSRGQKGKAPGPPDSPLGARP